MYCRYEERACQGAIRSMLSGRLYTEIKANLEKRASRPYSFSLTAGFSSFVSCRTCGYVPSAKTAIYPLHIYRFEISPKCHYCGYERDNYTVCPGVEVSISAISAAERQGLRRKYTGCFPWPPQSEWIWTQRKKNSRTKIFRAFEKEKNRPFNRHADGCQRP